MDVHGFEEDNIVVLLDDGQHPDPTMENMLQAYRDVVSKAEPGDSIFLHYSGHGSKIKDDDGDDDDGYDEVLVPLDYNENGMIRDDDLYDIIVKGLPKGVHVVSLVSISSTSDLPRHPRHGLFIHHSPLTSLWVSV
jgi:metacaspase-1